MSKIDTTAIERFMNLVKRASQARSRDVRLELTEASMLVAEIGALLNRLATKLEQTHLGNQEFKADGGSF